MFLYFVEIISHAKTLLSNPTGDKYLLAFKGGESVLVYSKSAGVKPDYWGVEINGRRGYVHKKHLKEEKMIAKNSTIIHDVPTELLLDNGDDKSFAYNEKNEIEEKIPDFNEPPNEVKKEVYDNDPVYTEMPYNENINESRDYNLPTDFGENQKNNDETTEAGIINKNQGEVHNAVESQKIDYKPIENVNELEVEMTLNENINESKGYPEIQENHFDGTKVENMMEADHLMTNNPTDPKNVNELFDNANKPEVDNTQKNQNEAGIEVPSDVPNVLPNEPSPIDAPLNDPLAKPINTQDDHIKTDGGEELTDDLRQPIVEPLFVKKNAYVTTNDQMNNYPEGRNTEFDSGEVQPPVSTEFYRRPNIGDKNKFQPLQEVKAQPAGNVEEKLSRPTWVDLSNVAQTPDKEEIVHKKFFAHAKVASTPATFSTPAKFDKHKQIPLSSSDDDYDEEFDDEDDDDSDGFHVYKQRKHKRHHHHQKHLPPQPTPIYDDGKVELNAPNTPFMPPQTDLPLVNTIFVDEPETVKNSTNFANNANINTGNDGAMPIVEKQNTPDNINTNSIVDTIKPKDVPMENAFLANNLNGQQEYIAPPVTTTENQAQTNEPIEVQTGNQQQENESVRVQTETQPQTNEPIQVQTENQAQTNEPVQVQRETQPQAIKPVQLQAETKPQAIETVQVQAETKPQAIEPVEVQAESQQQANEYVQVQAENQQQTNDRIQDQAENSIDHQVPEQQNNIIAEEKVEIAREIDAEKLKLENKVETQRIAPQTNVKVPDEVQLKVESEKPLEVKDSPTQEPKLPDKYPAHIDKQNNEAPVVVAQEPTPNNKPKAVPTTIENDYTEPPRFAYLKSAPPEELENKQLTEETFVSTEKPNVVPNHPYEQHSSSEHNKERYTKVDLQPAPSSPSPEPNFNHNVGHKPIDEHNNVPTIENTNNEPAASSPSPEPNVKHTSEPALTLEAESTNNQEQPPSPSSERTIPKAVDVIENNIELPPTPFEEEKPKEELQLPPSAQEDYVTEVPEASLDTNEDIVDDTGSWITTITGWFSIFGGGENTNNIQMIRDDAEIPIEEILYGKIEESVNGQHTAAVISK